MLRVTNYRGGKSKKRGIFFTIDAVFALYIAMLLMTAFMVVLQTQEQTSDDLLKLSRLARDVHEIRKENPGAALPTGFSEGAACGEGKTVGSAFILVYNEGSNNIVVSSQTICVSD